MWAQIGKRWFDIHSVESFDVTGETTIRINFYSGADKQYYLPADEMRRLVAYIENRGGHLPVAENVITFAATGWATEPDLREVAQ